MSWKYKVTVFYRKYGKMLVRVAVLGMMVLSISYTFLSDPASAYSMWDVTANYGDVSSIHPNGHTGIDFAIPVDTPLKSVVDGTIEKVRDTGDMGYGKSVQIRTSDGRLVIYAHLNDWTVEKGQSVRIGDIIGHSGNTGRSTGPHLHFQVISKSGETINPISTIMNGVVNKLNGMNIVTRK